MCSALNFSTQRRKLDASLAAGFRWLLRMISRMWIELDVRVTADVERKSERDRQEKSERAKRVQRSRELRSLHQSATPASSPESECAGCRQQVK